MMSFKSSKRLDAHYTSIAPNFPQKDDLSLVAIDRLLVNF